MQYSKQCCSLVRNHNSSRVSHNPSLLHLGGVCHQPRSGVQCGFWHRISFVTGRQRRRGRFEKNRWIKGSEQDPQLGLTACDWRHSYKGIPCKITPRPARKSLNNPSNAGFQGTIWGRVDRSDPFSAAQRAGSGCWVARIRDSKASSSFYRQRASD